MNIDTVFISGVKLQEKKRTVQKKQTAEKNKLLVSFKGDLLC